MKKTQISAICAMAALAAGAFAEETKEAETETQSWADRESLFLAPAAEKFAPDSGFDPSVSWTGEVYGNTCGGSQRGAVFDSLLTLGFEQDLSKIAKKDSESWGTLGVSAFWFAQSKRDRDFMGEYVGSAGQCASNIFSSDMVRVFEIYYKNEFETGVGTFGMRIGQLAADEDFMGMEYSDLFLNANLGAIPTNAGLDLASGAMAFSQYSLATFGATACWSNDTFDAIVGVYNGSAGEDSVSNHGFDYKLRDVAVWYQIGANYNICGLGGRAQFGGNYHSGDFENKYDGSIKRGFYSFYLGLQQDFIADKDGNAILGGFVRLAYTPCEEIIGCDKYIDCGLNWFGPIPGREDDVAGVAFSAMKLGITDYEYDNLVEITYRAQITPAIAIQPVLQMYLNAKDENGNTNAAYVVGARAEINF